MTSHNDPFELEILFEQVDGWFSDLTTHEPISHYARVRKKARPPVTKSNQRSNTNRKSKTLDSLAKDLEQLLEESDEEEILLTAKSEPKIYHFNVCNNDELALLDDSIGSCLVTRGEFIKHDDLMDWTSVVDCGDKEYSVSSYDSQSNSSNNKDIYNSNNRENNDLKLQTSMPMDHDYLPKPKAISCNIDNQYLSSNKRSKQSNISVLHTGVIKRFERFSPKFRELSLRLIAVSNSQ